MAFGSAYELPPWLTRTSVEDAVKLILLAFYGTTPPGTTPVTPGIPVTPASGAPTIVSAVASSSTVIPAGAFNIGILITSGTGTINGVSWPLNTPFNFTDKTSAILTLTLGNPGTAVINYLS